MLLGSEPAIPISRLFFVDYKSDDIAADLSHGYDLFAEFERENIGERSKIGKERKARESVNNFFQTDVLI